MNRLFGLNGVERYQTWPERTVTEAVTAPHDIIQPNPYDEGSELHQWYEDQRDKGMLKAAMAVSALAGTGGLAGTGSAAKGALTSQEIALGAGPMLRPALKFKDKIYKAPPNGQHLDALPEQMYNEFQKLAMSGEDISHYNFGFMNHKGQFLSREAALDYAIKEGLLNPNSEAARTGTLTSTMDLMADSSKPGIAIAANKPYANVPNSLMGFRKNGQNKGFDETNFKYELPVKVKFKNGDTFEDAIKGLNKEHALERARRNWEGADIEAIEGK
jgi:hypothetical protein